MPLSPGPFTNGSFDKVKHKVSSDSIAAREEALRIRDDKGSVVASLPYHNPNSLGNQELMVRASNAVLAAAHQLGEDPLKIARMIEDGEVVAVTIKSLLDGMNRVFSYMPELREKFPGQKLFDISQDELQKAVEEIKKSKEK